MLIVKQHFCEVYKKIIKKIFLLKINSQKFKKYNFPNSDVKYIDSQQVTQVKVKDSSITICSQVATSKRFFSPHIHLRRTINLTKSITYSLNNVKHSIYMLSSTLF